MDKLIAMIRSSKTSILSILPTVGTLAIMFGWVNLEQQTAIIDGVKVVFDSADSILNEVAGVIQAVMAVGLLFARDADKSSQDVGIR